MLDSARTSGFAIPSLERSQWASHSHFPRQVLLLGSHASFRRVSAALVDHVDDLEPGESGAARVLGDVRWTYRRWIAGMRSHERYEESKLYPYLARRWGASFEAARAGHERLHERHDEVLASFVALDSQGIDHITLGRLVSALRDHDATLREHLELEEDLVIPMLLELSPDEFAAYSSS